MSAQDEAGTPSSFKDAEAWLAERGVPREAIRVPTSDVQRDGSTPPAPPRENAEPPPAPNVVPAPASPPEPGDEPATPTSPGPTASTDADPGVAGEVTRAVAYALRATANAPRSEARMRASFESRGVSEEAIELALERCREQGIVDDPSFAAALVDEGRRKGHAPLRIRRDLRRRDLPADVIDSALARFSDRDDEIIAFDVAVKRAAQFRGLETETAYRRLVSYLARRGYTESLSRKVARMVVFNEEEQRRSIER